MAVEPIVIENVRIVFPHVFEPRQTDKGERYEVSFLIPKGEAGAKTIAAIKALCKAAVDTKWPDPTTRPRKLTNPLKDGDDGECTNDGVPKSEKYPEYAGMYFASASSKFQPGVVNQAVKKIICPDEIYSGCVCNILIDAYAYSTEKFGVSLGLLHIQKVKDGERLGGGSSVTPESVFKVIGKAPASSSADPFEEDIFG